MDEFLKLLQKHIEAVEAIGNKIENREEYMGDVREYLSSMELMVIGIFDLKQSGQVHLDISQEFLLQVLQDITYGVQHEDSVYLLDVLRYGLLEIYYYIGSELQGGEYYE